MVEIASPVYVMGTIFECIFIYETLLHFIIRYYALTTFKGDLHGNYMDLMYFEQALWQLSPTLSPSKLLFLGDYVDRGRYSVEVIAYLFAYKVQVPQKIILLRGNHEIRDIQKSFTFYQ